MEQEKRMDFFARQGARRQHSFDYGNDEQRRYAEKDAVLSCSTISDSRHWWLKLRKGSKLTDILKQEAIIKTVIVIVEDLVQDWELNFDEAIDQQTFLVNDLNFSSVDIIQLCVALEQNYECKLGFHELLMEDGKYVGDLSIKQISIFLESKLKNNQENRLE